MTQLKEGCHFVDYIIQNEFTTHTLSSWCYADLLKTLTVKTIILELEVKFSDR